MLMTWASQLTMGTTGVDANTRQDAGHRNIVNRAHTIYTECHIRLPPRRASGVGPECLDLPLDVRFCPRGTCSGQRARSAAMEIIE